MEELPGQMYVIVEVLVLILGHGVTALKIVTK